MIETKGLTKHFDEFTALNNLSIHVDKGSIYGLIGVNGSGKTTLIKHLVGVYKSDCGEVLFDGLPVYENEEIKRRIAYVPDDLYFYGSYSLEDMAQYYSGIYKNFSMSRFKNMVEDFNLMPKAKIRTFSKGMQKQAMFILQLSHYPEYLILDEPIDGLDPIVRKKVWSYVLNDVADRQMTVLVSSHNLREMEGICDYIGILSKGELKIEKSLEDLTGDVHKIQVAFPVSDSGAFAFDKEALLKNLSILHRESRGSVDVLIARGSRESVEEVLKKGHPLIMDILPLSLEEVFIYEMGGENDEIKDIIR